jgi:hypothetical protein
MGMDITLTVRPKLLHAVVAGEFSIEEAKRQFLQIADAIEQSDATKILMDGRKVTGDPKVVERFIYGEFAAGVVKQQLQEPYGPGPQFAYVLHEPVLDPFRFGETVAINRGMHVKVFDNVESAIRWLRVSQEDLPD